ncbi:HAMP domain-containing protein [Oculatella sp. LEGE 06141]|uniref:methyl-accepting chemotaxis protein n=1 Tax=Oculatella sp. LEGE 06141 TaxID=1828648 RepID=UPI0018800376|nr:cache domain-containing protein [Oculatella sp. LEGE 06141]MBE9181890.1 HAMP domain-containing protein [Oculatella sp. LEGE 06141]
MMTSLTRSTSPPTPDLSEPVASQFEAPQRSIWSSLRFKSMLVAMAIGTLPVLLIGTIGYVAVGRTVSTWIEDTQRTQVRIISNELGYFLADRFRDVNTLAKEPIFANAGVRTTVSTAEMKAFLNDFVETKKTYESVAFLDANGDDIAISGGASPLGSHADDDYFQAAIQGQTFISQPRFSESAGQEVVFFAAPVRDSDSNDIIGVVRTRIPVTTFLEVTALKSGQQGQEDLEQPFQFHLVDANGTIFASDETEEELGADAPPSAEQLAENEEAASEGESLHIGKNADEIFPGLSDVRQAGTVGVLQTVDALDDEKELLGYAPLPAFDDVPDTGWTVLLEVEFDKAFAIQNVLLRTIGLGSLLSVAVVGTVAAIIANRGLKPIEDAAIAVEQFSQGDFETRLSFRGNDEVATLGANLNLMADQIQMLLITLRQNAAQLRRENEVLFNLSRDEALIQGNTKAAAKTFTEVIAKTLNIERVSVWLYNSDRSELTSLDQFDQSSQRHSGGSQYQAAYLPNYFHSLRADALVAIDDVETDSASQELLAAKLIPPNTQAILIVPIQIGDRTIGIIRCDQVEETRVWQPGEQTFVYSIASLISLAVESETLQSEVGHLLDVVSQAGEGDLTVQAQVSDRVTGVLADVFNQLIERLGQVLNQVLEAAHQVSQNANQQKELTRTVASNAQQQSEGVNQVIQLTKQVEQSARGSVEKVNLSSKSLQTVSKTVASGQEAIAELIQGINVLQDGTNRMVQRMKTLGEFVGLADQFVQDQSQIAFITQTLALNASLVAARASEQRDPRQFIVVAREFDSIAEQVNKLAQQTNEGLTALEQSSAQIHSVVSSVDADVQSMGKLVSQFTQGVEQSSQVFSRVQTVTGEAVQAGRSVAHFNQRIVKAAEATAQVMQDIAGLAAKTADLTQTSQMQSDRIDVLSTQLLQSVQFFQVPSAHASLLVPQERVDLSLTETITLDVKPRNELNGKLSDELDDELSDELDDELSDEPIDIDDEPGNELNNEPDDELNHGLNGASMEFPFSPTPSLFQ